MLCFNINMCLPIILIDEDFEALVKSSFAHLFYAIGVKEAQFPSILEAELKTDFHFSSLMISTIRSSKKFNNLFNTFGIEKDIKRIDDKSVLELKISKTNWNHASAMQSLNLISNLLVTKKFV